MPLKHAKRGTRGEGSETPVQMYCHASKQVGDNSKEGEGEEGGGRAYVAFEKQGHKTQTQTRKKKSQGGRCEGTHVRAAAHEQPQG